MKRSVILTDRLGSDILSAFWTKGQVLHRERAHLKVPGFSIVLNVLLTRLIFTMDISSLDTVIPNSEGLLSLKYFFDQRTVEEPSSETLLRLAELVLTLNCFSFAGNYYKQINGVAMGTKMGPSYANLFVG